MQRHLGKFQKKNRLLAIRKQAYEALEVFIKKVIFSLLRRLRRWRKKVSYDCRKKVADSRLRIKGKFVNREQVS
jgi:hypothetical protein